MAIETGGPPNLGMHARSAQGNGGEIATIGTPHFPCVGQANRVVTVHSLNASGGVQVQDRGCHDRDCAFEGETKTIATSLLARQSIFLFAHESAYIGKRSACK